MGNYEILSIGDKLKALRKKYNLTQSDLSRNKICRNLISEIENNKANLTVSTAKIIIDNLNTISKEKGITLDINLSYLMSDEKTQAKKIFNKYIDELTLLKENNNSNFCAKLNEAEKFIIDWNFNDKKAIIFEIAGDYFNNVKIFYKSCIYYEKVLSLIEYTDDNTTMVNILKKLSTVYFNMCKYDYSIKYSQFALDHVENISKKLFYTFILNISLCHIKLNNYNIALKNLELIDETAKELNPHLYYKALTLKASCFQGLKCYKKSLCIYQDLINATNKNNYLEYIFLSINISKIYIILNENALAEKYVDESINNIKYVTNKNINLSYIFFSIGKIYMSLHQIKNSEIYYLKALYYAKQNMNYDLINSIFSKLINIYKFTRNTEKIESLTDDFFILASNENYLDFEIIHDLIDFCLSINNIKLIRKICTSGKNFFCKHKNNLNQYQCFYPKNQIFYTTFLNNSIYS